MSIKELSETVKELEEYLSEQKYFIVRKSKFNGRKLYIKYLEQHFEVYIQKTLNNLKEVCPFEYEIHTEIVDGVHICHEKEEVNNYIEKIVDIVLK